jgi:hypothetical protein
MEGFGPIALFVLWAVVSLLGRAAQGKKGQQRQRPPRPVEPSRDRPASRTGQPSTFEELLAEMRGELDRAKQKEQQQEADAGAESWERELEGAEEVEDRTSLEEEPEIVSLEVERYRPERPVEIAESDATEVLVQKRIAAAELRNREWRLDDHRQFDAAIRAPKPVEVRRLSPAHQTLRQAIIWNEVLQPPVSLRDTPRSDRGA